MQLNSRIAQKFQGCRSERKTGVKKWNGKNQPPPTNAASSVAGGNDLVIKHMIPTLLLSTIDNSSTQPCLYSIMLNITTASAKLTNCISISPTCPMCMLAVRELTYCSEPQHDTLMKSTGESRSVNPRTYLSEPLSVCVE